MAIDKNSKAYQWLLAKWYTDEQITQMHGAVAWGQTTQQAVANTTPVNTPKYENQGSGNYVYNEATGYYENTTPKTPTQQPTEQPTPTTPEVKQETETKQEETPVTTVPEIKQEWELKPLLQDYYNQTSDEAQSKIISNLNNYRQTNPEYFRDYESFKKNFSYDARNDEQKQTLDSWYGGYQKWMELAWIPVTDLYTQYKDGQVSMNELENLRVYDPTKYAELQNQINKWNIIAAYDDDKGEDGTWLSLQDMAYNTAVQMFTKFMSGDSSSGASQYFRDYEEKMESPEMLALSDQCTEVQEQMENIQSDLDSIKKQVEAEYEWTWATRSKINAIIADRSYDLQLQLRTLNSDYNKYATQYNNRMQQYQNEFNMQIQEYQINQQARNQQMNELWFAMDLMNFETNDQKQQREWDYWVKQQEYTNWNINSKDYDTRHKAALKSVENLLAQYPNIPMQRSAEQMADDILKAIDGGSNLGAELTKINKFIQEKPEYRYMYNQTFRPATSTSSGVSDTFTIDGQEYVVYNWKTMTAQEFNSMFKWWAWTWAAKPYTVVDESLLANSTSNLLKNSASWWDKNLAKFLIQSKNMNGSKWGQCGKFVNDYLQYIGVTWAANRYYDNDLSTKLNSVNSYTPKVWTIAVFDYGYKSKSDGINHGHVGIVTKVYDDWSFDMRDSNWDLKKPETIRTIHVNPSSSLKWFFDPSKTPLSSGSSTEGATLNTSSFTTAWNNIALGLGSVSATNTFNEQLQTYLDNWDYTSAFEYITTQAKKSTDSDTKSAINSAESAISALVAIQEWLDAFYAAWGDTNIFAGTAEQVSNRIWKTTNPKLKQLATQINTAIQQYRKAISGAAFTESEAAEYAAIFPSTKNDKELNTALIDGTLQTMLQNLNSNYAQILGTQTYTNLLKDYQDKTGDIYDYYWNKQWLTQYLKNNWYMNTGKTTTTSWSKGGLKLWNTSTTNRTTTRWTWVLKKSTGTTTNTTTVVTPNMSEFQSSTTNNLGNWLLSRTVNWVTQYSYDWWKTRH